MPNSESDNLYQRVENRINNWAGSQDDIRGIVVYGSRARSKYPADEFSDLDLVLFTLTPQKYSQDSNWLESIGDTWLAVIGKTSIGDDEWTLLFAGGVKVDIILAAATGYDDLSRLVSNSPYKSVFARGSRSIYEAEEPPSFSTAESSSGFIKPLPTNIDFLSLVNKRDDLIRSVNLLSCELRPRLFELAAMYAVVQDPTTDHWYGGRFIDQWADAKVYEELQKSYARLDSVEVRSALNASLKMIIEMATEISEALGYTFPTQGQDASIRWLKKLLAN
jgi:aminoglycoside 6-adenylyltransferase